MSFVSCFGFSFSDIGFLFECFCAHIPSQLISLLLTRKPVSLTHPLTANWENAFLNGAVERLDRQLFVIESRVNLINKIWSNMIPLSGALDIFVWKIL